MDKQHILHEIRRTAEENGGQPLGRERFKTETGIRQCDWYGKHWRNWGEALQEAGYDANQLQVRLDDEYVIEKLVGFIGELGRFPVEADLRMKARAATEFPSHTTFRRFGSKAERAEKAIAFCRARGGLDDVIEICKPIAAAGTEVHADSGRTPEPIGFVYLMKSGRFYKIGRTSSVGRREYELGIQLPEKPSVVHQIKTDDPEGIEEYWHKRFRDKRKRGEWFDLSPGDVAAFKRRKFM
jgi:hypothetical protein